MNLSMVWNERYFMCGFFFSEGCSHTVALCSSWNFMTQKVGMSLAFPLSKRLATKPMVPILFYRWAAFEKIDYIVYLTMSFDELWCTTNVLFMGQECRSLIENNCISKSRGFSQGRSFQSFWPEIFQFARNTASENNSLSYWIWHFPECYRGMLEGDCLSSATL